MQIIMILLQQLMWFCLYGCISNDTTESFESGPGVTWIQVTNDDLIGQIDLVVLLLLIQSFKCF